MPPAISIVVAPGPDGVNVAVYDAPLPLKFEITPPVTVISAAAKFDTDSEMVNATVIWLSFVVSPSNT